jgi:DNA-binding transcriptional MerR regulator
MTGPKSSFEDKVRAAKSIALAEEYTIDELAQSAQMTVRNVRSYQDKGLIPPPEIRGRTGIYSNAHLARLRVIAPMLARGYSLSNIAELLGAWEKGHDLRKLLGFEQALTTPWSEEVPGYYELSELLTLFSAKLPPEMLARAIQLNIIQVDGARFKVPSPRLLNAGIELLELGVPLVSLFDLMANMRANVDAVANSLVQLIVSNVFEPLGTNQMLPVNDVTRLAEVIWRLRSVADMAVSAELAASMERAVQRNLGERMDAIFSQLREHKS